MAAYRRVYDSRHLQADCQEPESAPEPYTRNRVWATVTVFLIRTRCKTKRSPPGDPHRRLSIAVNWSVNGVVRLRPSNQVICIFLCAPAECSSCTHRPVNRTLLLRLHFSPHAEISRTARELKSSVWIGGVDLARKIGCHGNVPRGIEKLTSDRSSTAVVLPCLQTG